jgi:hypothetical protein
MKIEYLLVIGLLCLETKLTMSMSKENLEKFDTKVKSNFWLCLLDSMLLNILEEDNAKELRENLGVLYQ